VLALHVHGDQPRNAAMLQRLGVGRGMRLAEASAHALLAAMQALLGDGGVHARAAALAAEMRRHDRGAAGAAMDVEEAVGRRRLRRAAGVA
jgi:rhamnosyltransferase subunit B